MRLTDAEWIVMQAVWQKPPATARDVLDRLGDETDWAYTTVKTLLDRLVKRGALRERKRGNASLYVPLVTQSSARTSALRSLLERSFGGSLGALVQHMAREERLTRKERERLAQLLGDEDSKGAR